MKRNEEDLKSVLVSIVLAATEMIGFGIIRAALALRLLQEKGGKGERKR